jgi:hypothetical protein
LENDLVGQCNSLAHGSEAIGVHGQLDPIALQATVGVELHCFKPQELLDQSRNTQWLHVGIPFLCQQENMYASGNGVMCLGEHTPWHSPRSNTATAALLAVSGVDRE